MRNIQKIVLYFIVVFLVHYATTKPINETIVIKNIGNNDTNKRNPRNSDIYFPEDDYDEGLSGKIILNLNGPPSCAAGSTFCENFNKYPRIQVKNILKKHPVNKDLFGTDDSPEFESRDGDSENFLCRSSVRTIFPEIGKNTRNEWKIIINQGKEEGYIQGVVIETCVGQRRKCDLVSDLVNDYVTTCKQKYIYRRLLSLNDNGKPVQDSFLLPSACCCTYRRNFDFLSRLGTT